jgi:hypothetical protein
MDLLKITEGDHQTPIPIAVLADLASAMDGVIEHFPVNMPLTLASLKQMLMPLRKGETIKFVPELGKYRFDVIRANEQEYTASSYELAYVLVEAIGYQCTHDWFHGQMTEHILNMNWGPKLIHSTAETKTLNPLVP